MKIINFDHTAAMQQEALTLLGEHLRLACAGPHAVMLTGGKTPLGLYKRIQDSPTRIDHQLYLLVSDERRVPLNSPQNNFAKMRAMIAALKVDDSRIMRVRTELELDAAADRYNQQLASFIDGGGRITLGILGLGADGHLASLFNADDLGRGEGRYAVAVPRESGPDRVSVTPDLLLRVERLVFLVAGPQKAEIVQRISKDPESTTAGRAVKGVSRAELWFSKRPNNVENECF